MADQKKKPGAKEGDVSNGGAPSFVPGEEPLENEQHELFVQELLMLKPQVRAYLKAYPGSSYNSARATSTQLLAKPSIQDRLAFLKEERRQRYRMTAEDIHERLVMAVTVDPDDILDADGKILPMNKIPADVRACIEAVETTKGGGRKVTFVSKGNALQMLGRHQKMFTDKIEHSGKIALEELVGGGE